jgi:hypothetical protein
VSLGEEMGIRCGKDIINERIRQPIETCRLVLIPPGHGFHFFGNALSI